MGSFSRRSSAGIPAPIPALRRWYEGYALMFFTDFASKGLKTIVVLLVLDDYFGDGSMHNLFPDRVLSLERCDYDSMIDSFRLIRIAVGTHIGMCPPRKAGDSEKQEEQRKSRKEEQDRRAEKSRRRAGEEQDRRT